MALAIAMLFFLTHQAISTSSIPLNTLVSITRQFSLHTVEPRHNEIRGVRGQIHYRGNFVENLANSKSNLGENA